MSEDDPAEGRPWLRLYEPPHEYGLTEPQEDAIRTLAAEWGWEDLRGFHMYLDSIGWDYYDVLRAVYE